MSDTSRRLPRGMGLTTLVAACFALAAPMASRAATVGLCASKDTAMFSCGLSKGRTVSLCARPDGALQYRIGKPSRLDLAHPAQPAVANEAFRLAHYSRSQVERLELAFDIGTYTYSLFDYTEAGRRSAGVRVSTESGQETVLNCRGKVTSRLLQLKGKVACDTDSALNLGSCP